MNVPRSVGLLLSSVALSALTVIFGAAPLKTARHALGAGPFWLIGLGLSALLFGFKMPGLALVLLVFTVAVGIWCELEQRGFDIAISGLGALLSSTAVGMSLFYFAIRRDPAGWYKKINSMVEQILTQAANVELVKSIKVEDLVLQLPSLFVIVVLLALALTAVLERPLSAWAGAPVYRRERLTDFRVPDFMIWAVIGSVFGAFWDGSPKAVQAFSLNVLNVCVVAYFFQGMAVLCKYCEVFRVSGLWRAILIVLFTVQLFFILSLVGVIDFWADFRKQFSKKSADLNKTRLSE